MPGLCICCEHVEICLTGPRENSRDEQHQKSNEDDAGAKRHERQAHGVDEAVAIHAGNRRVVTLRFDGAQTACWRPIERTPRSGLWLILDPPSLEVWPYTVLTGGQKMLRRNGQKPSLRWLLGAPRDGA